MGRRENENHKKRMGFLSGPDSWNALAERSDRKKLLVKAGLGEGRFPGEFLHFFLYDIIKNFCVAFGADLCDILYSKLFSTGEKQEDHGKISWNLGESDRGTSRTVTPFCSCSSIPIFMGIHQWGLPLGVTFSFLISSPMVDLGSLILLMSVFGGEDRICLCDCWTCHSCYGGTIIERSHMEDQVADFIRQAPNVEVASPSLTIADRMDYAKNQVVDTVKKVAPYIVVGVIIGGVYPQSDPQSISSEAFLENRPGTPCHWRQQ